MAGKYRSDRFIKYGNPLPYNIIRLPIITHWYNPIELINYGFQFLKQLVSNGKIRVPVEYDLSGKIFKVCGIDDMSLIWNSGFFGKGILSRSEPTWFGRTIRRLNICDDSQISELSNEEVVKLRRLERDYFKLKRKELDLLEVEYKANNDFEKLKDLEIKRLELTKSRNMNKFKLYDDSEDSIRVEDQEIILDDLNSVQLLEYLQLIPQEVIFLKLIDSITTDSSILDLFLELSDATPDNKFLVEFFVYYYYKSLNWCIKSGLKFSSNYIIYERGPVFQHAEFAIIIVPISEDKELDWVDMSSVNRVLSTVKKTMVLVYVKIPTLEKFNSVYNDLLAYQRDNKKGKDESRSVELIFELLKLYDLDQMVLNRWSPSKTRD